MTGMGSIRGIRYPWRPIDQSQSADAACSLLRRENKQEADYNNLEMSRDIAYDL